MTQLAEERDAGQDAAVARIRRDGDAFDRAYLANEIAFHRTVNGALGTVLIPGAHNGELKSLLETGLTLFQEHQKHAEHIAGDMR